MPPKTGRIVGYARVSTEQQNLDRQIDALQEHGCTEIFQEKITGTTIQRPMLKEACYGLQPGDTFVVGQLDRLGRSTVDTLRIINAIGEAGCYFRALDYDIDTSGFHGQFILTVFAAIAELERAFTRARTTAGLDAARERGKTGGRTPVVDRDMAKEIVELRRSGRSIPKIAGYVKVSESSVYRLLREKKLSDENGSDEFYVKYGIEDL